MKQHTCYSNDRRGRPTRIWAQDGYKPGTRIPHMVEIVTEWKAGVACGYLDRRNDPTCGNCPNRNREMWNDWEGGERPVAKDTKVEYKLRNGAIGKASAGFLRWDHNTTPGSLQHSRDIVAYQCSDLVIEPEWIEWHGGTCPVGSDVVVEYRLRKGNTETSCKAFAGELGWRHIGSEFDIVAYRTVAASEPPLVRDMVPPAEPMPPAVEAGWTEWYGGDCPFCSDVVVTVRFRDGSVHDGRAYGLRWDHVGERCTGDIVAYRLGFTDDRALWVRGMVPPAAEPDPKADAEAFLLAAAAHIADRAVTYDAEDKGGERSIPAVVEAFRVFTGITMTAEQGWLFMTLVKLVRTQQGAFRADSYEDAAAYCALMGEAAGASRG